jgi:hypothetical protein
MALDVDSADRKTLIRALVEDEFSKPVRIVAFNTAEGWSRDVTIKVADDCAGAMASSGRWRTLCWTSWMPTGADVASAAYQNTRCRQRQDLRRCRSDIEEI